MKNKARLLLDIILTVAFLLLMDPKSIGTIAVHEWLGLAICVFFYLAQSLKLELDQSRFDWTVRKIPLGRKKKLSAGYISPIGHVDDHTQRNEDRQNYRLLMAALFDRPYFLACLAPVRINDHIGSHRSAYRLALEVDFRFYEQNFRQNRQNPKNRFVRPRNQLMYCRALCRNKNGFSRKSRQVCSAKRGADDSK